MVSASMLVLSAVVGLALQAPPRLPLAGWTAARPLPAARAAPRLCALQDPFRPERPPIEPMAINAVQQLLRGGDAAEVADQAVAARAADPDYTLEAAEEAPSLDALAARVGYAPHHFHRLFKRATGVTPAAYARGLKAGRAAAALTDGASVTAAIYEGGYSAPSRFYEHAAPRLGMSPSAWSRGGAGVTIRWTIAATSLGPMLVAATDRGICRIAFDEDDADLRARFPQADISAGGDALAALAAQVVAAVESPGRDHNLPLDVRGTAFQEAIWQALRTIPSGETRSYAELAAMAGRPGAVRAAGSACGANHLPVLIPCHRVTKSDGAIGGYAYGTERKRALLERERERLASGTIGLRKADRE